MDEESLFKKVQEKIAKQSHMGWQETQHGFSAPLGPLQVYIHKRSKVAYASEVERIYTFETREGNRILLQHRDRYDVRPSGAGILLTNAHGSLREHEEIHLGLLRLPKLSLINYGIEHHWLALQYSFIYQNVEVAKFRKEKETYSRLARLDELLDKV